jgi:hypothetical protein
VVLIITLLQLVLPNGRMQRSMRLVMGAFAVLTILSPLTKLSVSDGWTSLFSTVDLDTDSYIDQTNEAILQQSQASIEALTAQTLQQINVEPEKIAVVMDTTEDNCIAIEKVVVQISLLDAERSTEIAEAITKELGIQGEVVIDGG